jgi:transposase
LNALTTELKTIVEDSGSSLMELPGVGPIVAARVLANVGDAAHSPTGPVRVPDRQRADRGIVRDWSSGTGCPGREAL